VYALLQRDEAQRQTRLALAAAREAKGRQLALEAEAIQRDLTGSIASERAAALAIEGWRRQPSHVAYEAAAIALTELPVWRHPGESGGGSIAFLPDGEHAVHGADHDLSVWNVARNHELFRKTLDLSVTEVAISPDGALLAVAGFENHVLVFGAANGAER
ncbi:MAG: hypothetical protein ACREX8_03050, partial [Gammaproteobacteria bacterium]